ncbi:hypothetical protein [Streptomyces sp. NPDC002490]|uniref:hypothetical protein n=1 Tax=Streptomyces sp. NPDC002490 TaxID=3154416 RepID=UPI00332ABD23
MIRVPRAGAAVVTALALVTAVPGPRARPRRVGAGTALRLRVFPHRHPDEPPVTGTVRRRSVRDA